MTRNLIWGWKRHFSISSRLNTKSLSVFCHYYCMNIKMSSAFSSNSPQDQVFLRVCKTKICPISNWDPCALTYWINCYITHRWASQVHQFSLLPIRVQSFCIMFFFVSKYNLRVFGTFQSSLFFLQHSSSNISIVFCETANSCFCLWEEKKNLPIIVSPRKWKHNLEKGSQVIEYQSVCKQVGGVSGVMAFVWERVHSWCTAASKTRIFPA